MLGKKFYSRLPQTRLKVTFIQFQRLLGSGDTICSPLTLCILSRPPLYQVSIVQLHLTHYLSPLGAVDAVVQEVGVA